jgi:Carbohydrate-binding module 48 (Isoamylase N-terminal domain)
MITRGHDMPFGTKVSEEGVTFALWAPSAHTVDVVVDRATPRPMSLLGDGGYKATVAQAHDGSRYRFRIDGALLVSDPASRFQPDGPFGNSRVVDPRRFVRSDDQWLGRPWNEAVFYEAHIGVFTPEAHTPRLPTICRNSRNSGSRHSNCGTGAMLPEMSPPFKGESEHEHAVIDSNRRRMMRRVCGTGDIVDEERLGGIDLVQHFHVRDSVVRHGGYQIPARFAHVGIDLGGVAEEVGLPLAGVATDEAVKVPHAEGH